MYSQIYLSLHSHYIHYEPLVPLGEEEEEESSQDVPKTTVTIEIEERKPKFSFKKVALYILKEQKESSTGSHMADVVLQYVAKIRAETGADMLSSWGKVQIQHNEHPPQLQKLGEDWVKGIKGAKSW